MKHLGLTFLCVVFCFAVSQAVAEKKIVCYLGTWAYYRWGVGKFTVDNIHTGLCTHLMYAFFGINEDGTVRIIDPYLDLEENWGLGYVKRFNDLKKLNSELKTMAAIGGWNEKSLKFSKVSADPVLRKKFIDDCVKLCQTFGFDGIDLDWEYPSQQDSPSLDDKDNHAIWLEEFRVEFDRHGLLLSAAVASAEFSSGLSYHIARVSAALDFINVMTYDLHGPWDFQTGLNSPLYEGPADVTERQKQMNTNASIQYWLSQGADPKKIILGIPLYGRTFTLAREQENHIGAPINGPGMAGPFTREPGFIGYNEFCDMFAKENWDIHYSQEQVGFYAVKGNQWIGFDNVETIEAKVQYMHDNDLGGIMVWSLETDDYHGLCGPRYALMNTVYRLVNHGAEPPAPPPAVTTPVPPTGPTGPNVGECDPAGIFPNPDSCQKFFVCTEDGRRFDFECPDGLLFDPVNLYCNWKDAVHCELL
ncbi:chitinase-3-like protein 1 [Uranotaenia lowii]|uniref:chitinase-3-like protein 1 n=1 Tax=Uranotaenia lowii TaxID=190385 RepID=UPI002478449E|nr:chitinase-3-like protein 1 [Uranotaenia lowii]